FFFFQAEDGIRDLTVTGVQTCALPISRRRLPPGAQRLRRCPRPAGPGRAAETGTLMRIIAGEFRGRTLRPPSDRRVRPTADRVREAWFSILGPNLPGASVLDLFAGSGALGLEALSRGAERVDFVEISKSSLDALRSNVAA